MNDATLVMYFLRNSLNLKSYKNNFILFIRHAIKHLLAEFKKILVRRAIRRVKIEEKVEKLQRERVDLIPLLQNLNLAT